MGVSFWAYAWASKKGWESMPDEYKMEFGIDWGIVKQNEEGVWFKLNCAPSSPWLMGYAKGTDEDMEWARENAQDFQCVSVDDSGYGGMHSNPPIDEITNNQVRWKNFVDADLEFKEIESSN